jgi:hypothetical protein
MPKQMLQARVSYTRTLIIGTVLQTMYEALPLLQQMFRRCYFFVETIGNNPPLHYPT